MVRAVVCREFGAPESLLLEEFPSRALKPGEVRVAIRAARAEFS
ncbi:NADPH:quinone reductase-like Zn-dependent oxidoreductase [Bradyrhizobium diazoefficiens]